MKSLLMWQNLNLFEVNELICIIMHKSDFRTCWSSIFCALSCSCCLSSSSRCFCNSAVFWFRSCSCLRRCSSNSRISSSVYAWFCSRVCKSHDGEMSLDATRYQHAFATILTSQLSGSRNSFFFVAIKNSSNDTRRSLSVSTCFRKNVY